MAQLSSTNIYGNLKVTNETSLNKLNIDNKLTQYGQSEFQNQIYISSLPGGPTIGGGTDAAKSWLRIGSGLGLDPNEIQFFGEGYLRTPVGQNLDVGPVGKTTRFAASTGQVTFPARINFPANTYIAAGGVMNLANSDIIGANAIYFADESDGAEGVCFPKSGKSGSSSAGDYDVFKVYQSIPYFNAHKMYHEGNKPTKGDVGLGNVTNESKQTMFTNPAFSGTPTAPTAATTTNNTQIATTAFVKSAISATAPAGHSHSSNFDVHAGNEANFATGITGGTLYINYRGATSTNGITETVFNTGKSSTVAYSNVVANEFKGTMRVLPRHTYSSAYTKGSTFNADTTNLRRGMIVFDAATGSNDPGAIYHESSGLSADVNKGVLHLCPTDDNTNDGTDYVTIHGTNDPEAIKMHTGGSITTIGSITADSTINAKGGLQWNGESTDSRYAKHRNGFIPTPTDGTFSTTTSTYTGYLKITLPQSWTNTMLRFDIKIYEYSTGRSSTFTVGGYNYTSTWANNPFAYCVAHKDSNKKNLSVRFGHDGTKCAIYIGEANTTWSFPQIQICNIVCGYSNTEYSKWRSGWAIGFTTTLGTITATISNTNVALGVTCGDIGALPLSGGSMTGNAIFNNNTGVQGKNTSGTAYTLAKVTADNFSYIGTEGLPLKLASNANPVVNISGTVRTLYHTGYRPDYIYGTYISGGSEKPNYFGSNKLKLQMLQGPSGWGWSDTLWMSSYAGGDVKGSNQLVISKGSSKIGFRRQNYDATDWGGINEIYHTGFKPTPEAIGAAKSGVANTDMNLNTTSGCYRINSSLTNAPGTGYDWGQLLVLRGGGDTITQIISDYNSDKLAWRSGNPSECGGSGTYKSWRRIYHEGYKPTPSSIGAPTYDEGLMLKSLRDFTNGTLIKTTIDGSNGIPFFLEIKGNSYGSGRPFNVTAQGYQYDNTVINHGGVAIGSTDIKSISCFVYEGKLCFWLPRYSYWQGYSVWCSHVRDAGRQVNEASAILNVAKPTTGISREVTISVAQGYTTANKPSLSDLGAAPSTHYHPYIRQSDSDGMRVYGENSNEVNFGGTNNSGTIYFGYRAKDSKPIPTTFTFGGSTGTATIKATKLDISTVFSGAKEAMRLTDGWLRLNPTNAFSSGIYCNTGILRTDGEFQVGGNGETFKVNGTNVLFKGVLKSTGTGHIVVEGGDGSYREGIRLNRNASGWSTQTFGAAIGSASGTGTGIWSIHRNPDGNFGIVHNNSDIKNGLGLYQDGSIKWKNNQIYHAGSKPPSIVNTGTAAISGTELKVTTSYGYIDIGPKNSSHCHIYTDAPSFYTNKEILVNGNRVLHLGDMGLTTISKTLVLTTDWLDTGISGTNLATGSYMVQISGMSSSATAMYTEYFTGVMSWFADGTNSGDSDEILLHKAGHASNGRMIYLRTIRLPGSQRLKLQIAASTTFTSSNYTFKFRRLI